MKTIRLLILTIFSLVLFSASCEKDPPIVEGENGLVYLDANGVTIKAFEDAQAGDTDILHGVTYTIVDSAMLYEMVEGGEDVSDVVTTLVTNMYDLFYRNEDFNQNISSWDVSKVTTMRQMFSQTSSFNQDIGKWDVSNVTDMYAMFFDATAFNQDISKRDVTSVNNMNLMFFNA